MPIKIWWHILIGIVILMGLFHITSAAIRRVRHRSKLIYTIHFDLAVMVSTGLLIGAHQYSACILWRLSDAGAT